MGWFDEQIKERKRHDDEVFEESFLNIAGAVLGRKMSNALRDNAIVAKDAIGDVLKYYRIKPEEVPDTITDLNDQLEYLLRPQGIMRRDVLLSKGWYKDADGPMLGYRADNGTVLALIPDRLGGYYFVDITSGQKIKINKKNENLIDNEAIAFYRSFPLKKMNLSDIAKYILGLFTSSDIVTAVISTLVVTVIGMLMPRINQILFGDVIEHSSINLLVATAVFLVCTTISSNLMNSVKEIVFSKINMKIENAVSAATMMRILSLPASFFGGYSSGELTSYSEHMNTLSNMLVNGLLSVGLSSVFSLLYVGQIGKYAPSLVVPALLVTLVTLVLSIVSAFMQMQISKKSIKLHAKTSGLSYALISGVQKIKLSGAEKRAFSKWGDSYAKEAELKYNPPMFIKINSVINVAITTLGTLVMYYYAIDTAYGMLSGAFLSLSGIALMVAEIRPIIEAVKPILDAEPEITAGKHVLSRVSGSIELNNVTFKYKEDMPNVLENLSLKVSSGQYVAIVGRTGCGKSTLVRLLLGFEKPNRGAIYYDGKDLETIDPKSLRKNIGVVLQNGKLFQGDIFTNITISAPWLTLDEAWAAAEIAGVADDIRRMPMGMNTMIAEGSGGISGGQKQRLMIARAVAPKPKILIFDEATSALDNITQKKVSEALDNLKCTRIVIAHRLSTIKQCDRIVVLDKGNIIEDGTYDELIAKNGYFAELVERQRLDLEN